MLILVNTVMHLLLLMLLFGLSLHLCVLFLSLLFQHISADLSLLSVAFKAATVKLYKSIEFLTITRIKENDKPVDEGWIPWTSVTDLMGAVPPVNLFSGDWRPDSNPSSHQSAPPPASNFSPVSSSQQKLPHASPAAEGTATASSGPAVCGPTVNPLLPIHLMPLCSHVTISIDYLVEVRTVSFVCE